MTKNPKPAQSSVIPIAAAQSKLVSPTQDAQFLNGLEGVVQGMFPQGGGFGGRGVQVAQADTLFRNMRNYLISNMRLPLSYGYAEIGLFQNVCDVPVDDGLRGGVTISSKQLDEDQIARLTQWFQYDLEDTADEESENVLHGCVGQALKWNRAFGGAFNLIITGQDPESPLEVDKIKEGDPLTFKAGDLWELYYDRGAQDSFSQNLFNDTTAEHYSYYGRRVHKSRVIRYKGIEPPSMIRQQLRGWGLSTAEALLRSINNYLKSDSLVMEVLDEFKVDVFKVRDLVTSLLSADGEAQVTKRLQLASMLKSFMNALVMDGDDDYEQKQIAFTGLAEMKKEIRIGVCADMRMPEIKLFGTSSGGGLSTSGQDEIEVYNGMVESQVRHKALRPIVRILRIKCQQMFGMVPDDLTVEFKPLRMMSAKEEEEVKTSQFNRLHLAKQSGEITPKEYREAINKQNLLPIKLDVTAAALNELDAQAQAKAALEAGPAKEEEDDKNNALSDRADLSKFPGPKIVSVGLVSNGQILTGKRRDNGLQTNPGGHMDEGESIEGAAVREVLGETGISIGVDDLRMISAEKVTSHRTGKEFVVFCFLANVAKEKATAKNDPDQEVSEWKWVDISPDTPELKEDQRHAKSDSVLKYLLSQEAK